PDTEHTPAELGILAREIQRVPNGRYYEIPASAETRGHGTSGDARYWKHVLAELLGETVKPGQGRSRSSRGRDLRREDKRVFTLPDSEARDHAFVDLDAQPRLVRHTQFAI